MVNLNFNLNLSAHRPETAELALLVVVVGGVELGVLVGKLDGADEQVVLLVRGVGAQDQTVHGIVLESRKKLRFVLDSSSP